MQSRIFTTTEQDFLEKRLAGKKNWDTTGIFSRRIKPKLQELLEYWFPKRKELQKLLLGSHKKRKKQRKHSE